MQHVLQQISTKTHWWYPHLSCVHIFTRCWFHAEHHPIKTFLSIKTTLREKSAIIFNIFMQTTDTVACPIDVRPYKMVVLSIRALIKLAYSVFTVDFRPTLIAAVPPPPIKTLKRSRLFRAICHRYSCIQNLVYVSRDYRNGKKLLSTLQESVYRRHVSNKILLVQTEHVSCPRASAVSSCTTYSLS